MPPGTEEEMNPFSSDTSNLNGLKKPRELLLVVIQFAQLTNSNDERGQIRPSKTRTGIPAKTFPSRRASHICVENGQEFAVQAAAFAIDVEGTA